MRAAQGLLVAAAVVAGALAEAGEEPADPPDWREQARDEGLTPAEIERLAADKVLIGVRTFPQVFSAYDDVKTPVLVTSDSVIRAYGVLLEECLAGAERARAARLPSILRSIWPGIPIALERGRLDPARVADARRRAQVTIGTALRLLGEAAPGAPADVAELIDAEARRVETATETVKPSWLGPPDRGFPAIEYGAFRPRGLYAGDEPLERYFRAAKWLRSVPFRAGRRDEFLAALVVLESFGPARGAGSDRARNEARAECERFVRAFARFLGADAGPSIFSYPGGWHGEWTDAEVERVRGEFVRAHARPAGERGEEADLVLRVLPEPATPDAALLGRTQGPGLGRDVPSGLDVAAALGSSFALRRLDAAPGSALAAAVGDWPEMRRGDDLFRRYLRCLAALLDAPDANAPAFLRTDGWAAKSVNAALAGWAQGRHAWTLNARETTRWLGVGPKQPGWVEPDPAFFARFAALVADTETALDEAGAFDPAIGRAAFAADLRRFLAAFAAREKDGRLARGWAAFDDLDAAQRRQVDRATSALRDEVSVRVWLRDMSRERDGPSDTDEQWRVRMQVVFVRETAAAAEGWLRHLEDPVSAKEPDAPWPELGAPRLRERWRALARIAGRLEAIAVKELRGSRLDAKDCELLRNYAKHLAFPMLYDSNLYARMAPPDVPGAVCVFSLVDPDGARPPKCLHAAYAMPCALYVLWPDGGREVLCRGAVVPYREFVAGTRLTDAEWRALLDSKDAPPPPAWLAPITSPPREAPR